MASDGLSFPGAAQLARGLSALGPKLGAKVADKGLKAWSKPIIAEAKATVVRRSGGLARSITDRKVKSVASYSATHLIGFRRPAGSHAHFIEFGNSHQAAHPFMRPAIDTQAEVGVTQMGRVLAAEIDAVAAKMLKEG